MSEKVSGLVFSFTEVNPREIRRRARMEPSKEGPDGVSVKRVEVENIFCLFFLSLESGPLSTCRSWDGD